MNGEEAFERPRHQGSKEECFATNMFNELVRTKIRSYILKPKEKGSWWTYESV